MAYLNLGQDTFSAAVTIAKPSQNQYLLHIAAADLNQDGYNDLVASYEHNNVGIPTMTYLSNADRAHLAFSPVSHPDRVFNFVLADKFSAGALPPTNQTSLLGFGPRFGVQDGNVDYCPNIGSSGRLQDCKTVTGHASSVKYGVSIDLNSDGLLDVVATAGQPAGLFAFCYDGSGFSFAGLTGKAPAPLGDISAGDLDEDGHPDIVAQYTEGLVMYLSRS